MARLKNIGPDVYTYAADGTAESLLVETGQTIEVLGPITEELDDAYIIGAGDDRRAWPKAQWELPSSGPATPPVADTDGS